MNDNYRTLGISRDAGPDEVKRAFRSLARELHPDLNPSESARERFLEVKEAYEVLSDPERRRHHDRALKLQEQIEAQKRGPGVSGSSRVSGGSVSSGGGREEERRRAEAARRSSEEEQARRSAEKAAWVLLREQTQRLAGMMNSGRLAEAEDLARTILRSAPREAVAYGALGDVARVKGHYAEAAKQYAFAAQFDSGNPVYQRRHEEMVRMADSGGRGVARDPGERSPAAFLVGVFVVLAAAGYTGLAQEGALAPGFGPVSTWTLGQWVCLFVAGVGLGASLSASDLLDAMDSTSSGAVMRGHPGVALGMVAVVNFWLALGLYALVGVTQRAFHQSVSRLMGFAAAGVVVFGMARWGAGWEAVGQTLLWGGNVLYMGGMLGWAAADSVRRA